MISKRRRLYLAHNPRLGITKVGVSSSPECRIDELRKTCDPELVLVFKSPIHSAAYAVEALIKQHFRAYAYRSYGSKEYFELLPTDIIDWLEAAFLYVPNAHAEHKVITFS